MFRGKLSAAFQTKARNEGKPEIAVQGRYVGGVKFYGDQWITFDENKVNMDAINGFADAGYLDLDPLTVKDSRPPVELEDVMAQAETELEEDAEIEAEVAEILAEEEDNRCQGIKGDGERCTRNALDGEDYCKSHLPKEE
jgi:hypothetical protein